MASIPPKRNLMVAEQIEQRGIHDPRVLDAMRRVPRELFVPPEQRAWAFHDGPLPIGWKQTISQPYMVAYMAEQLHLNGSENVLEIGSGSGYQAAVLSMLAATVHTVELVPELAEKARLNLLGLGYKNVVVHTGDGTLGWPPAAPYHGIIVTAAAPRPPQPLLEQLAEAGRMVIPIGHQEGQLLQVWRKTSDHFEHEDVLPVTFVPLRGQFGWKEEEW
jgi:protein-L-isoaspartate(D-aspartate) O-methyltransferase